MKTIALVFKNLIDFVRNQKRILLIMIFSLAVSTCASLYIYGVSIYARQQQAAGNLSLRKYTVTFERKGGASVKGQTVNELIGIADLPEMESICLSTILENDSADTTTLYGIGEYYPYLHTDSGRTFTKDEIDSTSNVAIVSALPGQKSETIKVGTQTFNVIGSCGYNVGTVYIPYTTYLHDNNYDIQQLELIFKRPLDEKQVNLLENVFNKSNLSVNILLPPKTTSEDLYIAILWLIIIALILFLCMINVASLFRYWIEENKYNFMIYKICGAGNGAISALIILEAFFIGLVGFIIGAGLFYVMTPYFEKLKVFSPVSIYETAMAFVIYTAIIYISIARISVIISRTAPADKTLWG